MKEKFPLSRQHEIVIQDLNDETLIYDLQTNQAFCLNETASLIWQLCDGKKSIAELSRIMSEKLGKPVCEDLVRLAIDQLKDRNLFENASELKADFSGLSRRALIRKIGLSSMIALPLVSAVIAPTATQAASSCGQYFTLCSAPSDCCPNVPSCSAGICCVSTGTQPANIQFFAPTGTCTTAAPSNCCSGRASFDGSLDQNTDICRCQPLN